jgi:hypothetical protein
MRAGLVAIVSSLLIFCIIFSVWTSSTSSTQPGQQTTVNVPKAAILDALYASSPNLAFEQNLTGFLSTAGYHVDVFRGENVTIDLLRNIGGYKVLILRVHSAIHTGDGFLYLFSGENYTQSKYVLEQSSGIVKKGETFEGEDYFALNAVFLGGNRPTGLRDSTIILMGCNGTGDSYSIQRLLDRGVKTYIGWTGYVDLSLSDEATLALVKTLYVEKSSVVEAVQETMTEVGSQPASQSVLEYYPRGG